MKPANVKIVMPDSAALHEYDEYISRLMSDPRWGEAIERGLKRAGIRFSLKRRREAHHVRAGHAATRAVLRGELPHVRKHMVECN